EGVKPAGNKKGRCAETCTAAKQNAGSRELANPRRFNARRLTAITRLKNPRAGYAALPGR
ncbi:hypothetical protein, partial [Pseudomonas fragariae (ex Marin et al. 2024)]